MCRASLASPDHPCSVHPCMACYYNGFGTESGMPNVGEDPGCYAACVLHAALYALTYFKHTDSSRCHKQIGKC